MVLLVERVNSMVTIKEIAESLNLSSATVSRALRNDETLSISVETKTKIFMAAEQMGYVAKGKKSVPPKPKQHITVIHEQQTFRNQIDSSYYFSVRAGIEDLCIKKHYSNTFVTLDTLADFQTPTDGIVIVGNYTKEQFDLILSKFKEIPMVTVGIVSYYPEKIDHITFSNQDSMSMALEYLFQKGHTKIGYMGIEEAPGTSSFGSRKQYYIDIMKEKRCFKPEWLRESSHGRDRVEQGYLMMKEWLSEGSELPTAIFCANDPVALGVVRALFEAQIEIPGRISILTHDGSYPTQYSLPPLSTIDVHPYQLGKEAIVALSERISKKREHTKKVSFYPELIERESVQNIN